MRPLKTILVAVIVAAGMNIAFGVLGELGADLYNLGKTGLFNQTGGAAQGDSGFGILSIIFGAISLGLVIYVLILLRKKPTAASTIEELPKVYDGKNPEVVNDFLDNMKNDCLVSGISLGTFATGYQDKIADLIKKGKHFTFLLPHPNSKFMKEADDKIVSLHSRSELINELKRFNQLHNRLQGDDVNKMKVKFHHLPLVHSMLVVDPELEDDGKMDISLYDFNKDSRRRTGITIKKKHSKQIFDKHYRSLKVMLDDKGTSYWDFKEFLSESNQ